MDKYQEFALKHTQYVIYEDGNFKKPLTSDNWLDISDGVIKVKQLEDYNKTKYVIRFNGGTVKSVTFNKKEYSQITSDDFSHPSVIVPIDFANKVNKLTIHYECFEDTDVSIEYEDANKEAFDEKLNKEHQDELAKKAAIKISTGADLVNIYFQPCNDTYAKTTIDLYLANGKYSTSPMVMGKHDVFHPQLLSASAGQLMGKFSVEDGMLFKSITGLAHHAYGVKVSQFDKNGNLLFTTDFIYFDIR